MMEPKTIETSICAVIAKIQSISGLDCPPLSGSTIPARDVQEFKSEVWPVAVSMISEKIEIEIPNDENLFCDDATQVRLTINQCVEKILRIANKKYKKAAVNE